MLVTTTFWTYGGGLQTLTRAWIDLGHGHFQTRCSRSDSRSDAFTNVSRAARHRRKPCRERRQPRVVGYTFGMKTAVSIPDEVFQRVERFARRAGRSRSEVFSAAIQEYVARHAPDEVTDAMDRVCADMPDQPDAFVRAAGRRALERTEW